MPPSIFQPVPKTSGAPQETDHPAEGAPDTVSPQPQIQVAKTHSLFPQNENLGPRPEVKTGSIRNGQAPPASLTAGPRAWHWAEGQGECTNAVWA